MNLQDEIIQSIELLINKKISNTTSPRTVSSVIKKVKGTEYLVSIDGKDIYVPNGTNISFSVGSKVWVHIPNDISNAFIMGRR